MLKKNEILVPKERVFADRRQGCWSCKHWDSAGGKRLWEARRQGELGRGLEISLNSFAGEKDPRVVSCRKAVNTMDHSLAQGAAALCTGGGVDANDNKVEFTTKTYLCGKWTAKPGEKNTIEKADPLPGELLDRLDGPAKKH